MLYTGLPEEKKAALSAIAEGKNVFITGAAGTGKSYLLGLIKEQWAGKGLHITASTGIAAVQIGGVTLHSWAGLGVGTAPVTEIIKFILSGKGTMLRRKLKKAKILAIDEISMISASLLDVLDEVLKTVRNSSRPFGGLQLILLGDFLQLPPVSREADAERHFCFESVAWQEADIQLFMLRQVFRQEEENFTELLQEMRHGALSAVHIALLKSRIQPVPDDEVRPTILTTHNHKAESVNRVELEKLPGEVRVFTMQGEGQENRLVFLKKNCLSPEQLALKTGAQVMMLKNTLQKEGIINGSLGVVKDFTAAGFPIVRFMNGKLHVIEPEEWLVEEYDAERQMMVEKAKIIQVPLMLAWAITVHKSQGMTLDRVECDVGSAFEEGQVYVALSRVKTLEGLYLRSFNPNVIKVNPKVVAFYQQVEAASTSYFGAEGLPLFQ